MGNRQISPGPEAYVVRQCAAGAGDKISNALDTGDPHTVAALILVFSRKLPGRRVTGEKAFNHKLEKAILRRKLLPSAEGHLPDFINRISILLILPGQTNIDVVLSQPF